MQSCVRALRPVTVIFGILLIAAADASSPRQQQTFRAATSDVEFEIASVEAFRSRPAEPFDGWVRAGVSIPALIADAYGVRPWHVVGLPEWASTARYDVFAKRKGRTTGSLAEWGEMVQALLIDRFDLRGHREVMDRPMYALSVAGEADGREHTLRRTNVDCETYTPETVRSPNASARNASVLQPCVISRTGPRLLSSGMTMGLLASMLSNGVGRVVIDSTGLEGYYEVAFSHEALEQPAEMDNPRAGVSVSAALQQQLGLMLEPRNGRLEVLVVDRIRRPALD